MIHISCERFREIMALDPFDATVSERIAHIRHRSTCRECNQYVRDLCELAELIGISLSPEECARYDELGKERIAWLEQQ